MSQQKASARAFAPKAGHSISGPSFGPDPNPSFKAPFPDKMMEGPFPYAYAIIEGPPGKWSAVCLEGVTAREVQRLEPNGDPEPMVRAMTRVTKALEIRTIAKKWGAP